MPQRGTSFPNRITDYGKIPENAVFSGILCSVPHNVPFISGIFWMVSGVNGEEKSFRTIPGDSPLALTLYIELDIIHPMSI